MNVFGLTGGIGTGKSASEQWLRRRSVPVIDTDALARQVVEPGQPALLEIQQAFGSNVIDGSGRLRRDSLAALVFSDTQARQTLERITHPRIRSLWRNQIESWRGEKRPVAVVVIPLLFETGAEKEFDAVICTACSAATQRGRLRDRGWTPDQIEQRLAAQWPLDRKMAKADFVIWTEGSLEIHGTQLDRILGAATGRNAEHCSAK